MSRASTATDVQPIDRLEEKVRQLVQLVDTLRAERARALDDAARLQHELDAAQERLSQAATAGAEIASLREERDLIKTRVVQMIGQIDRLNL
jgi:uncharacterized coiled-coil DUF342 family protein